MTRPITKIFDEIEGELESVLEKWGPQDHPLTPNDRADHHVYEHRRKESMWKEINDQREKTGRTAWDGIVLEEVYEAFAEADPVKARAELIQAAAMCIATIESIDRAAAK